MKLITFDKGVYSLSFDEGEKATYEVLSSELLLCRKAERIANRLMHSAKNTELYWFRLAVTFNILGDIIQRELNERIDLVPDYYLNELTQILEK